MKIFKIKFLNLCKLFFGYGIMFILFAGGLTFPCYFIALLLGGNIAVTICTFIYQQYIPLLVYISSSLILFGLLLLYLSGEKILTLNNKQNSK